MYYGGRPQKPHTLLAAVSICIGIAAGLVVGYFTFLAATAFVNFIARAVPTMTVAWFFGIWITTLALPVLSLRGAFRRAHDRGTRWFAVSGIVAIVVLFALDVSGAMRIIPHTVPASTGTPSQVTFQDR